MLAAHSLGADAGDNFLDSTFLADRRTTVRAYLQAHPDIMTEQPPSAVAGRYSG